MISVGVRINVKNNFGFTPLHIAVESENAENATILLKNLADPNIPCEIGTQKFTPMHLAKTKELVRVLLEHNADPFALIESFGTEKRATPITLLQRLLKICLNK